MKVEVTKNSPAERKDNKELFDWIEKNATAFLLWRFFTALFMPVLLLDQLREFQLAHLLVLLELGCLLLLKI
jgi:hypothetical protein